MEKVVQHEHGEVTIVDIERGELVSGKHRLRAGMRSVSCKSFILQPFRSRDRRVYYIPWQHSKTLEK